MPTLPRLPSRQILLPFFAAVFLALIYLTLVHDLFHRDNGVYKPRPLSKRPPSKMPTVLDKQGDPKTQEELDREQKTLNSLDPCTVYHPASNEFIDLRQLSSFNNPLQKPMPWIAKGYDSGHNYTVGICSTPIIKLRDKPYDTDDLVVASKVGAFYLSDKDKYVSLGEFSTTPRFVGKKLSLLYENGAYCDKVIDSATGEKARRSTLLTFTCSRSLSRKAVVQYVGSFDDCKYIFEVKSVHACPTAPESNNLAATGIFLLILLTALGVFYSGEILYRHFKTSRQARDVKVPFDA